MYTRQASHIAAVTVELANQNPCTIFSVEIRLMLILQLSAWQLHFYRAAWNADAVWRWEFCLSVRLSACQTRVL